LDVKQGLDSLPGLCYGDPVLRFEDVQDYVRARYPEWSYAQLRRRLQLVREVFPELVEARPGERVYYDERVLHLLEEVHRLEQETDLTLERVFGELRGRWPAPTEEADVSEKEVKPLGEGDSVAPPQPQPTKTAHKPSSQGAYASVQPDLVSVLREEIAFLRRLLEHEREERRREVEALKEHYEGLLRQAEERFGQIWAAFTRQQEALPKPEPRLKRGWFRRKRSSE